MMGRQMLSGLGLLAGLAGFFAPIVRREVAPLLVDRRPTRQRARGNDAQNPMGTVPNRGLRRIQGRQRAK